MLTTLTQLTQRTSQQWLWSGSKQAVIDSIVNTPLYKGDWYWIMPNNVAIDYESDGDTCTAEKVTLEDVKFVYWGEHPSEFLLESAIEDGEITDDEVCVADFEVPAEMNARGDEMLREILAEWLQDDTGITPDLSGEVQYYSRYGGYFIESAERMNLEFVNPSLTA